LHRPRNKDVVCCSRLKEGEKDLVLACLLDEIKKAPKSSKSREEVLHPYTERLLIIVVNKCTSAEIHHIAVLLLVISGQRCLAQLLR
jgi:hypothetical protein